MTYLQEILLRWWYRILILKSIMGAACIRVYIRRLDRVLYQYSVHSGYIYIFFYYASFHRRGVKQPRRKTHSTLLSVIYIVYILFFNKPIICCSSSLCFFLKGQWGTQYIPHLIHFFDPEWPIRIIIKSSEFSWDYITESKSKHQVWPTCLSSIGRRRYPHNNLKSSRAALWGHLQWVLLGTEDGLATAFPQLPTAFLKKKFAYSIATEMWTRMGQIQFHGPWCISHWWYPVGALTCFHFRTSPRYSSRRVVCRVKKKKDVLCCREKLLALSHY